MRHGGLGINILSEKASRDYESSLFVTSELVDEIKQQGCNVPPDNQYKISLVKHNNEKYYADQLESFQSELSPQVKRSVELASEKGASNWLVALPLKKIGFVLNRSEFIDAVNLRYHREFKGLPAVCPYVVKNSLSLIRLIIKRVDLCICAMIV